MTEGLARALPTPHEMPTGRRGDSLPRQTALETMAFMFGSWRANLHKVLAILMFRFGWTVWVRGGAHTVVWLLWCDKIDSHPHR